MRTWILIQALLTISTMFACAGGAGGNGTVPGNETGSGAINADEVRDYKRAILKCYKTGGSRVVKIEGKLMCY